MTTPVYMPAPQPMASAFQNPRAYPSPTMQAFVTRRPIGVGGVADAVGTAVGLLEICATIAVIIVGTDILLKWAGHPLHHGR